MKKRERIPKTIDEYLKSVSEDARPALEKIRATIRAAAPEATEKIGYRMPMFYYRGPLVAFASFKDHSSFFPMSVRVMDAHKEELRGYSKSKGTIRFPIDRPLTATLIRRLVKARIAENDARAKRKQKKKRGEGRAQRP